jgi:deoxyribonuclease-2
VDPTSNVANGPLVVVDGATLDCGRSCALGATLSQLLGSGASQLGALMWNDEPPAGAATVGNASTSGHTKGVVGVGGQGGFWLTHSVPLFPVLNGSEFSWNGVSDIYAQTFLCVSIEAGTVDAVAAGLQYVDPWLFDSSMPAALQAQYPALAGLLSGQRATGTSTQVIGSAGGHAFTHFAKSGSWGQDLYEDLVQPALQADALWETWRRSPVEGTFCRPTYAWDSININSIALVTGAGVAVPIRETQDHSKWGVTMSATAASQWLCVGDINRMTSQWAEGGGTVCTQYTPLFLALNSTITTADACTSARATSTAAFGGAARPGDVAR